VEQAGNGAMRNETAGAAAWESAALGSPDQLQKTPVSFEIESPLKHDDQRMQLPENRLHPALVKNFASGKRSSKAQRSRR